MKGNSSSKVSDAAGAGERVGRGARASRVQRAVGLARRVAAHQQQPAPARGDQPLTVADLRDVRTTAVLTDREPARWARRAGRALGLPRTRDDAAAWAALGGLAALVRVADDGRRRAVVVDTGSPRSLFSRWAAGAGFAPLVLDVTRPDVVGERIEPGAADLVAALHPRRVEAAEADVELVRAASAVRRGGVVTMTVPLGPAQVDGLDVPGLRALVARADEQGLSLVGDLDIDDAAHARAALRRARSGQAGLALLTFRRR